MDEVAVRQAFDEAVFSRPFYRVVAPGSPHLAAVWSALATAHPELMGDARVPPEDLATADALERLGFRRICTQVALEAAVPPTAPPPASGAVRATLALADGDLRAHASGFRFARFAQDPRVQREQADLLMMRWISNSLSGRREVVTDGRNFLTFSTTGSEAIVDLLSVLDGGRGVARALLDQLLREARRRGLATVRVTTEAENIAALRVYDAASFRPRQATRCLHFVAP